MSDKLVYYAGKNALAEIRENGLSQERIKVIAGAAGGPKWLVLNALDRVMFSEWFKDRAQPLNLIGASIGAWRFSAIARNNPLEGMARFLEAYIYQRYTEAPDAEEISAECIRVMDRYLTDNDIDEVLSHPYMRLSLITVRSKTMIASDNKAALAAGLVGTVVANTINRKLLRFVAERGLFYDQRTPPPFIGMNEFPIHRVPLSKENIRKAILGSGAIPLVMKGIQDIPGAPPGTYRDGGVIDYHLDIDFQLQDGIVLFPHFVPRIIPGWLDKALTYRKPSEENMKDVLLIAPSVDFAKSLPLKRIPDRSDFRVFKGDDASRIRCWKTVIEMCRPLGDEFMEAVLSGKIREKVRPISGM